MLRIFISICLAGLIPLSGAASAQTVSTTLAWDPNTEADLAGYILDYGEAPGRYTRSLTVGRQTELTVGSLTPETTYYFSLRAYNTAGTIGPRSNEVRHRTNRLGTLLWRHQTTGDLVVWYMDGTRMSGNAPLGPGRVSDLDWVIVGTGDWNKDGQVDVFWRHRDGRLSVWLMNGTTMIEGRLLQPERVADTDWHPVAVADMDGDGQADDLIWQHASLGALAVWMMSGTTLLDGRLLDPAVITDLGWRIVGTADFNADGHTDLLFRHQANGSLAVWFMNNGRRIGSAPLSPGSVSDTAWEIRSVADMNGDTMPDIVWQHSDGRLAVWLMNGTSLVSGESLGPGLISDTNWRIFAAR